MPEARCPRPEARRTWPTSGAPPQPRRAASPESRDTYKIDCPIGAGIMRRLLWQLCRVMVMTTDVSVGEIKRRRTFAIISHPDAGKTTLTEKLLLFGGAIQLAGTVKGRKAARHATSDWMALEKQRGISITSSVMQFPFRGQVINLLDTPGHEDFSEDTYRTLTAVDSALMVIDCAKGVEERTIKLMEVCRLRDTPIMTFINKLDREGRAPIELLDEIEKVLRIRTSPVTWPIGMGRDLAGVYHLLEDRIYAYEAAGRGERGENRVISGLHSAEGREFLGDRAAAFD